MFNYQKKLVEREIAEYIHNHQLVLEPLFAGFADRLNSSVSTLPINYDAVLDEAPEPSSFMEEEPLYRPVKTNYLKLEQDNRQLGELGERFVINYERWRLRTLGKENLADKIEWVSKELGDGLGYDILSHNTDGTDRYIEVKSTKLRKETPIYISKNEISFAAKQINKFFLYRVFKLDSSPQLFIKNGPYSGFCTLVPQSFKGYF